MQRSYRTATTDLLKLTAEVNKHMPLTFSATADSRPRSMQVAVCDSHAYADVATSRFQSIAGSAAATSTALAEPLLKKWSVCEWWCSNVALARGVSCSAQCMYELLQQLQHTMCLQKGLSCCFKVRLL